MQNRSIATVIILTIVTCGIYGIYWVYVTSKALETESRNPSSIDSTVLLVLCLLIPFVGYLLFGITANDHINAIKAQRGIPYADNKVAYILLGFFIPIVLVALIQNEINKMTF